MDSDGNRMLIVKQVLQVQKWPEIWERLEASSVVLLSGMLRTVLCTLVWLGGGWSYLHSVFGF